MPQAKTATIRIDEQAVERWFLQRGLPTMLPKEARQERVWHRMLAPLIAVYLFLLIPELFSVGTRIWAEVTMAVLVVVVPWAVSNLLHGQRPLSRLQHLGWFELAVFLIGPAFHLLITGVVIYEEPAGETWSVALLFIAIQVVALIALRILVGLGVAALAVWLLRELVGTIAGTMAALARTLPLLLGVVTFFFFTAEIWQSVGRAKGISYALILLTFVLLGALFLASRRQLDLDALTDFSSPGSVEEVLANGDHPFTQVPSISNTPAGAKLSLNRRQTFNLRLVAVLSRMIVAVVVATAVGLVFTVLGVLAIDAEVVKAWTAHPPTVLWDANVAGRTWIVSWEHIRVVGFLATFTGFYFSVVSATDTSLREGINDTAEEAIRTACAVRLVCLNN